MKEKMKQFIKKHGTTIYIGVSGAVISVIAYKMGWKMSNIKGDDGMRLVSKTGLVKFFDLDGNELSFEEATKYFNGHVNEIVELIKTTVQ